MNKYKLLMLGVTLLCLGMLLLAVTGILPYVPALILLSLDRLRPSSARISPEEGSKFCRDVRFSDGWDAGSEGPRALVFRTTKSKNEVLVGMRGGSDDAKHYRIVLDGNGAARLASAQEWRDSAEILTTGKFWLDESMPVPQSDKFKSRSPDGRFTASGGY